MRAAPLLAAAALLLPATALAQSWGGYGNARYPYYVEIPPGFVGQGESDNGDGEVFIDENGVALRVWGALIPDADFAAAVAAQKDFLAAEGWDLSYEAATYRSASFSGTRDGTIVYWRSIALCHGEQIASFEIEYPASDRATYDPLVTRLVQTFQEDDPERC